jgi:Domain of unknown function (DUF4926)
MPAIEMHSVVALIEDLPEEGLVPGQVGTVVENWDPKSSATRMAETTPWSR